MTNIELKERIVKKLDNMESEKLAFVDKLIDSLETYFPSQNISSEEKETNLQKHKAIKSLRGMASSSSFNSEDFAYSKQREIEREERIHESYS